MRNWKRLEDNIPHLEPTSTNRPSWGNYSTSKDFVHFLPFFLPTHINVPTMANLKRNPPERSVPHELTAEIFSALVLIVMATTLQVKCIVTKKTVQEKKKLKKIHRMEKENAIRMKVLKKTNHKWCSLKYWIYDVSKKKVRRILYIVRKNTHQPFRVSFFFFQIYHQQKSMKRSWGKDSIESEFSNRNRGAWGWKTSSSIVLFCECTLGSGVIFKINGSGDIFDNVTPTWRVLLEVLPLSIEFSE